jgi:hypothetical protein
VCMRRVELGSQECSTVSRCVQFGRHRGRECAGEVSRVAHRTCVSVLEKFPGCHPINCEIVLANFRRVAPKKVCQCPLEFARVAAKNGVCVQAKCRGWHPKI